MKLRSRFTLIVAAVALTLFYASFAQAATESFRIGRKIVFVVDAPEPDGYNCSSQGVCTCDDEKDCDDMLANGICKDKDLLCQRDGKCVCWED